jgi:hypothetical protein
MCLLPDSTWKVTEKKTSAAAPLMLFIMDA